MSDQNLPDQNKSNQNMNAQPETASDQLAPDDATINGNLFVTGYVTVGPFAATTGQGGIDVTGSLAEFGFVRRDLNSFPTTPAAGDRFVWYNPDGTARLFTGLNGDLLTVTATGNVGIGTINPLSMLHIGDGLPTPPSGGYRPWMVRGTQVSWDTDNVFFGLKDEGENRKDAVIAWGDDANSDVFRFIFTANGGPGNGQEIMRLQPNGNVGIGTNNPRSMLHIGDGLPNPPSGGYRDWMVRGTQVSWDTDNVFFGLKDEGENRKDAVIAWGDDANSDVFRFIFTANGGLDNGQEIMRLQPNGNVGIGTTNPTGKLQIEDGSAPDSKIMFGSSQGGAHHLSSKRDIVFNSDNPFGTERGCFYFRKTTFDNLASHRNLVVITEAGDLKATGDVYARNQILSSSRELKENIAELSGKEAVEALKNLNPVKFNFKADSDKNRHIGFIAEDVPELVATSDRKTLSPMDIVAVLTQALKEQQNTISALAEKVKVLEAKTA